MDERLNHEECMRIWCPRLCPLSQTAFPYNCVENNGLPYPKITAGFYFNKSKESLATSDRVKEIAVDGLPSHKKLEAIAVSPIYIQIYYSDKVCIFYAMREILGEDFTKYFTNYTFKNLGGSVNLFELYLKDKESLDLIVSKIKDIEKFMVGDNGFFYDEKVEVLKDGTYLLTTYSKDVLYDKFIADLQTKLNI